MDFPTIFQGANFFFAFLSSDQSFLTLDFDEWLDSTSGSEGFMEDSFLPGTDRHTTCSISSCDDDHLSPRAVTSTTLYTDSESPRSDRASHHASKRLKVKHSTRTKPTRKIFHNNNHASHSIQHRNHFSSSISHPTCRRIPADDIRRTFAVNFADILNLGDPLPLSQFLRDHATPSVQLTMKGKVTNKFTTSTHGRLPTRFAVAHGFQCVMTYLETLFAVIPDFVFDLQTTTIIPLPIPDTTPSTGSRSVHSEPYVKITALFHLQGHQVLDWIVDHQYTLLTTPSKLLLADPALGDTPQPAQRTIALAIDPQTGKIDSSIPPTERLLVSVLPKLILRSWQGQLTFRVNPDKKIDTINFIFVPCASKSLA